MIKSENLLVAREFLKTGIKVRTFEQLEDLLSDSELSAWFVTLNSDIVRQLCLLENDELCRIVLNEAATTIDGAPIRWFAKKLSRGNGADIVTGNSLWQRLQKYCDETGRPFVFAGGSSLAQSASIVKARQESPNLNFVCVNVPYSSEPTSTELSKTLELYPDAVVMVGLGALKQERFISNLHKTFPRAIFVGCGAAGDFYSGISQRAPSSWQRLGLEWLFRLMMEPKRLFKRYILEDAPFLLRLFLFMFVRMGKK